MKQLFLILLLLSSSLGWSQDVCKSGDCNNGFGYSIKANKDFHIGYSTNSLPKGAGLYYIAEKSNSQEIIEIAFYRDPQAKTNVKTQSLTLNMSTSEMWFGRSSKGFEDFEGLYFDKDQTIFKYYSSGNLPIDLSESCLDGNCSNGYGIIKWTDSKGLNHFYCGGFVSDKFQGDGIEFIPQESKVLIGKFLNDACPDGILYDLNNESATRFVGGVQNTHITFTFPVYAPPIDPAIASNIANAQQSQQNAVDAKKEKRKKFWNTFGTVVGVAAATVAVVAVADAVLDDDGGSSSSSSSSPSKPATSRTSSQNTSSNQSGTRSSQPAKPKCSYAVAWKRSNDVITITNIFQVSDSSGETLKSVYNGWGYFMRTSRTEVSEKREDLIRQYVDSEGYEFKPKSQNTMGICK